VPALITLQFVVPAGYEQGDYAMLHGSEADGEIDWETPLTERHFELFPNGAGIYGWGHAPWGNFRWGCAHSMRTPGWGELPWGRFPWGYGTAVIKAVREVGDCGLYKFGLACYDKLGNPHTGTPGEASANVHTAPYAPAGLKKNSYNKDTDVLVLDVA
jgi:hypothetical protein